MLLLSTLRDSHLEGVEWRECFFLSIIAIKFYHAWTNMSDDCFQFPCKITVMKCVRYLDRIVNRSAASMRYGLSCRSYI